MSRYNTFSFYSLVAITTFTLSACGGTNTENDTSTSSDHPQFKWANTAASNNFLPLGDITDQTPTFSWSAYTDNGLLATEYNFGHQSINRDDWIEYTVPAASAGCASGGTCSYTPANKVFAIGEQRPWWVRGKINAQWNEWSDSHVFKVIDVITPPPTGSKLPSGDTASTNPEFKWPRIGTASQYEIGIESQSGSGWKSYRSISCTTTSCTHTPSYGFSVGDQMTWWVRPSSGTWSNGVDFNITRNGGSSDTQSPSVPGSLNSTATTTTSASISWNASTDNVAVTGYQIIRNGQQVATTNNTNYTDTALRSSTQYTYSVRAVDAASNVSNNSNTVSITTNSGGSGVNNIFTWSPIAGATSYTFGIELSNGTGWQEYPGSASSFGCQTGTCSFTPTGYPLNIGDKIFWFIKPNNGNWSNTNRRTITSNGSGTDTQAPTVPTNVRSTSVSSNRVVIAWNASTDNTAVTGYRVFRNGTQVGAVSGLSFTDNVNATTNYAYTIKAIDAANNVSATSSVLNITTPAAPDTQSPTTPTNLQEVTATQTAVAISWNASTDNVAVTGYRVYQAGQLLTSTTNTNFTDTMVAPNTAYAYTVTAVDAAGNESSVSSALNVTTPPIPQQSGLVINEVLAGNTTVNMDTDFYAYSDWIELYNNSNSAINLDGYYLSDDVINPKKWAIPSGTTIDPQAYVLIWADKKDQKAKELHSNFSLSSKGETLTLADTTGAVIDTLIYTKIDSNISVAKSGSTLVYMEPTPSAQNTTGFATATLSTQPNFSDNAGFFSSRVNLVLSQANNSDIYYTLDGSTPTPFSTKYTGSITLDNTTVIKAFAIEDGKLPSKVATNTYFINHQTTLPVVSLSMENAHLFDDTVGIYTVGTNGLLTPPWCGGVVANYQQDWDRPAYVEYFDQNHNRALAFGADTAISGECSRKKAKKSFGFELDGKYGTKSLSYKLFAGKSLGKIKDFKIRTANSGYRTGDILGAQLIEQGGLDIDYQAYRAVQMFMNGEYWGIYNIREKKGAETLAANYPNLGKVDIIKAFVIKKGNLVDYAKFNTFLSSNDLANTANYQQALTFFDESSFIDYIAYMIYNGNQDWLDGNQRTWKEKKAGAKWRWMSDDIDWGFIAQIDYAGQGSALNTNQFNILANSVSTTNLVILYKSLMKNNTFRSKFKTRFNTLLNTVFTPNFILPIINSINDERKDYMRLEKFAGMPLGDYVASYTDYIENDLRAFVRARTNLVKQQLEQAIP